MCVFRQWLCDSKVPSDLVNKKVTDKENLPPMINQPNPDNFPSIETLERRQAEGEGPIVQTPRENIVAGDSKGESENKKRRTLDNEEDTNRRKSTRIRSEPQRYGRGRGKKK